MNIESQRTAILDTINQLCKRRVAPLHTDLNAVMRRLYMEAYLWRHPGGYFARDLQHRAFETATALSVLFLWDGVLVTYPPEVVRGLPFDKGNDDYGVRLRYTLCGVETLGSRVVLTKLRLREVVMEDADGNTKTLSELLAVA